VASLANRWLATWETDLEAATPEIGTSSNSAHLVAQSLELAAVRCPDLTPLVYEKLFRAHPEAGTMFRTEANNAVEGSMLQIALEAVLAFVGERKVSYGMIACEVAVARCLRHIPGAVSELFRRDRRYPAGPAGRRMVARDRHGLARNARRSKPVHRRGACRQPKPDVNSGS
jgi:hypothetical protein